MHCIETFLCIKLRRVTQYSAFEDLKQHMHILYRGTFIQDFFEVLEEMFFIVWYSTMRDNINSMDFVVTNHSSVQICF